MNKYVIGHIGHNCIYGKESDWLYVREKGDHDWADPFTSLKEARKALSVLYCDERPCTKRIYKLVEVK